MQANVRRSCERISIIPSWKNLRRTESPERCDANALSWVFHLSWLSPPSPTGRLSLWNRAVWEIGKRCAYVSLSLSLLSSMPGRVTIHFPTGASTARAARPTFLSYHQPFSPCRFSSFVNVCLYIQLDPPPPPLTLVYSSTPLLSLSVVRNCLTHDNMQQKWSVKHFSLTLELHKRKFGRKILRLRIIFK